MHSILVSSDFGTVLSTATNAVCQVPCRCNLLVSSDFDRDLYIYIYDIKDAECQAL